MKTRTLLLMCILPAILCTPTSARIIFVDDDATGVNDGSSWEDAYVYLQDALADTEAAEKPTEIHVAQGIYKPMQGIKAWPANESRFATFSLINNVAIKGGYAGVNEPDPNERNIELYESILSGDLNGDDVEVDDPCDLRDEPTFNENSVKVLLSDKNDANAVLDGFTIRGGCNRSWADPGPSGGGGMVINNGNPTIINCTFTKNTARDSGGGALILSGSPTLIDCTFTKNYANSGAGIYNGRIFGGVFGSPVPKETGNPTLKNCKFIDNYALSSAGGMGSHGGNPKLFNCIFSKNFAQNDGGGFSGGSNVELENCTFYGNWAIQNSSIAKGSSSILRISNCIIWDGQNAISDSNSSTLIVSYSDIQGGWEGEGNIDVDPLFANPGYWAEANDPTTVVEPNDPNAIWIEGDYHLKSQAGRFDPDTQSWIQDDVTSPCIDAGDPNSPIGYEPFPNGGYINMGAYGGTSEASKSYFGKPVCETVVAGDINGDCKVDILDLEIMMQHWLEEH